MCHLHPCILNAVVIVAIWIALMKQLTVLSMILFCGCCISEMALVALISQILCVNHVAYS